MFFIRPEAAIYEISIPVRCPAKHTQFSVFPLRQGVNPQPLPALLQYHSSRIREAQPE